MRHNFSFLRHVFCPTLPHKPVPHPVPDCDTIDRVDHERDVLRFSPELFAARSDVIARLAERGIDWLSHYSSVDPIHDCYGIEVCGIHETEDAESILGILIEMFPDWKPG